MTEREKEFEKYVIKQMCGKIVGHIGDRCVFVTEKDIDELQERWDTAFRESKEWKEVVIDEK
jgi:hypothetical protein